MRNIQLKLAFFEAGLSQREVAERTGIPEVYISLAVHGRYVLDEAQKNKIATALNKEKVEIFGNNGRGGIFGKFRRGGNGRE